MKDERRSERESWKSVCLCCTSSMCSERKSLLELKCFCKTSCTDLSSHRVWRRKHKHRRTVKNTHGRWKKPAGSGFTRLHLHAVVPVLTELLVGEAVRQAELGPDPLQVLRERRVAQQVDLTVREPRLHPLLQQLQNILDGGKQQTKPHSLNGWN